LDTGKDTIQTLGECNTTKNKHRYEVRGAECRVSGEQAFARRNLTPRT
jgi:hypothetical protein